MCDSANHVDALRRFRLQPKEDIAKRLASAKNTIITVVGEDGIERRIGPVLGLLSSTNKLHHCNTRESKSWPNDY